MRQVRKVRKGNQMRQVEQVRQVCVREVKLVLVFTAELDRKIGTSTVFSISTNN